MIEFIQEWLKSASLGGLSYKKISRSGFEPDLAVVVTKSR